MAAVEGRQADIATATGDHEGATYSDENPANCHRQQAETTLVKSVRKLCLPPPCGARDGKVTKLTLRCFGSVVCAQIKVVGKDGKTVFNGAVEPADKFSFEVEDQKGALGTEIEIYVGGCLNTTIHTSCSRPIGQGLVKGGSNELAAELAERPDDCNNGLIGPGHFDDD